SSRARVRGRRGFSSSGIIGPTYLLMYGCSIRGLVTPVEHLYNPHHDKGISCTWLPGGSSVESFGKTTRCVAPMADRRAPDVWLLSGFAHRSPSRVSAAARR